MALVLGDSDLVQDTVGVTDNLLAGSASNTATLSPPRSTEGEAWEVRVCLPLVIIRFLFRI